jgi:predicted nuclease of predicted toxin-antitoxin system
LTHAKDNVLWHRAQATAAVIVSKDEDFADLVRRSTEGPMVVWLRTGTEVWRTRYAIVGFVIGSLTLGGAILESLSLSLVGPDRPFGREDLLGISIWLAMFGTLPTLVIGLISRRGGVTKLSAISAGTVALFLIAAYFEPSNASRRAKLLTPPPAHLRTINAAETAYRSSYGHYGNMLEMINAGLLDSRFSTSISGYTFAVTTSGVDYTAIAMPTSRQDGQYGYSSYQDAIIRYPTSASPTCDPCFPIGLSGAPVP